MYDEDIMYHNFVLQDNDHNDTETQLSWSDDHHDDNQRCGHIHLQGNGKRRAQVGQCRRLVYTLVLSDYCRIFMQHFWLHLETAKFVDAPTEQHPQDGKDARITCRVESSPQAEIVWSYRGTTIDQG